MKRFRIISQIFFLLLFLYIFLSAIIDSGIYSDEMKLKGGIKYIFAIDPLLLLTTLIANISIEKIFILSLPLVILTFVFGRFFCGWVCPMGTINHIFSKISPFKQLTSFDPKFYKPKYIILLIIIIFATFKINLSGYLDPLSILVRSFGVFLLPIVSYGYDINILPETTKNYIFYNILGRENFYYSQSIVIGIFFVIILFLNFFIKRLWCTTLCPLGALYGIISRYAVFKISKKDETCYSCMKCSKVCAANAGPGSKDFSSSECMLLLSCTSSCPSIEYKISLKPHKIDLRRRYVVASLISAISGISLIKVSKIPRERNPDLIRPPGSKPESEFLSTCIRCGACMKVCPENFLQPAFIEAGIEGLWTPIGKGNFGYCLYNCNLCGQVCPTGAIKKLSIDSKKKFVIGTAYFDKNRCLPYAFETNCMVCEEHCPTSPKAIYFKEIKTLKYNGEYIILKQPHINPEQCIGCGICQYKCPVEDKPAIYITAIKRGG
ncbi:MAG: 4Fe-4S dicluster domain-containing protein, partial [Calditerrivibrio sp.]|nr:4Fe-4S dicluster domain-containing protein [Calditerrivibrio sp.]